MLTQQILESKDPIAFARKSFEGFRELLLFIEAEKANFQGESLMYFNKFAESLVDQYLSKLACEHPLEEDLSERKENLENADGLMAQYAEQLRGLVG